MSAAALVVRPHLHARRGHQLVAADGRILADLEVAEARNAGAIVVDSRRWSVHRPPTGRVWTVTAGAWTGTSPVPRTDGDSPDRSSGGEVIATITKPSAIRERFEIEAAGDRVAVGPRGPIGRRCWVVTRAGAPMIEVVQGVVRRRWHELLPAQGAGASSLDDPLEPMTLLVAFTVALVDTAPPSGLAALRRPRA